jgi:hypothetical protein
LRIAAKNLYELFMSNPLVHAFFVGRAVAQTLGEQLEASITNALSELGKFDAEQREWLRQFTEQVIERANQEEALAMQNRPASSVYGGSTSEDLQAMIDELRAETAQLRAELQRYRSQSV